MSKSVLVLVPRLDVPFKNLGPIPPIYQKGPISPIRMHWANLVNGIGFEHENRGDKVQMLERPLWQFTPDMEKDWQFKGWGAYDVIYVPHRETHSFPLPGRDVRYYMQSVFPHLFYIDPKGFAGGSSMYPFGDIPHVKHPYVQPFNALAQRGNMGISKFDQPGGELKIPGVYSLYTCQIPHDQTIMYHSDVSVEEALIATLESSPASTIVVRGHPVNQAAMEPLKAICAKYPNAVWNDTGNIHDIIRGSRVVITVNSGTGMEALLHKKPVITFGRCEYDCVTGKASLTDLNRLNFWINHPEQVWAGDDRVYHFFDLWSQKMYNANSINGFTKLP